jgi:alkanesulfonate monooxygenase SsuD/methylene tetrahydromethanopterin reductase-like flavin-dependent oxidoreductase (luciferase family)
MDTTRPFRFGAVVGTPEDLAQWPMTAQELESLGYTTLLLPDTLGTPSTFPALAAAAAVTSTLRVGSWVLASPYRTVGEVVRDTATLQALSGGRLELGIGAGRPGGEGDARELGTVWGSPGERVGRVEAVIDAVRERVSPVPRIVVAGSGPRMMRIAGAAADTLAIALSPAADAEAVREVAERARQAAGERAAELELSLQITGIGDQIPEWIAQRMGLTAADLIAAGAAGVLSGDAAEAVASLRHLREVAEVSYLTVPGGFARAFAPVVQQLTGT